MPLNRWRRKSSAGHIKDGAGIQGLHRPDKRSATVDLKLRVNYSGITGQSGLRRSMSPQYVFGEQSQTQNDDTERYHENGIVITGGLDAI
jgi:hypothetical protein